MNEKKVTALLANKGSIRATSSWKVLIGKQEKFTAIC